MFLRWLFSFHLHRSKQHTWWCHCGEIMNIVLSQVQGYVLLWIFCVSIHMVWSRIDCLTLTGLTKLHNHKHKRFFTRISVQRQSISSLSRWESCGLVNDAAQAVLSPAGIDHRLTFPAGTPLDFSEDWIFKYSSCLSSAADPGLRAEIEYFEFISTNFFSHSSGSTTNWIFRLKLFL